MEKGGGNFFQNVGVDIIMPSQYFFNMSSSKHEQHDTLIHDHEQHCRHMKIKKLNDGLCIQWYDLQI